MFSGEIESIYLVGSQVDKSYSEISDIDLLIILKKENEKINEFVYHMAFLTPVVVDIKLINKYDIITGRLIVDPCIHFKRKLLFGSEDTTLFNYTMNQYNDLNYKKIIQILDEFKDNTRADYVLDKSKFKKMSTKKFLSLVSRLARLTLGIKYNIVTYTKDQTLLEFKNNGPAHLSQFLEKIHSRSLGARSTASVTTFLEYYDEINKEIGIVLPSVSFN